MGTSRPKLANQKTPGAFSLSNNEICILSENCEPLTTVLHVLSCCARAEQLLAWLVLRFRLLNVSSVNQAMARADAVIFFHTAIMPAMLWECAVPFNVVSKQWSAPSFLPRAAVLYHIGMREIKALNTCRALQGNTMTPYALTFLLLFSQRNNPGNKA